MVKFLSVIISAVISFLSVFGITLTQKGNILDKSKLEKNITASAEARLESGELTGAHIIVNQCSEKLFDKTFGLRSAGGEALKDDAVYRIASMTKPVTAVALLIEYERGNIDIYKDVSEYLPGYKDLYIAKRDKDGKIIRDENGNAVPGEKAKNSVKVYQLVSHTSGIACDTDGNEIYSAFVAKLGNSFVADDIVDYYSDAPLDFEPGTDHGYSTAAFDIAAKIIEKSSGLEFEEYLRKNIFDPLGMKDTTFEPSEEQFSRMVCIHGMANGRAVDVIQSEGKVFGELPVTYHAAGAGLASTAYDYDKFAGMLLNGGKSEDGKVILSEEMVKLMATPVREMNDGIMNGNTQWGLGVRVIVGNDNTLPKGSFGWSGAYGTHFWIDPLNRISAVYMKNSAYDGGAGCKTGTEFEEDVMKSLSFEFIK